MIDISVHMVPINHSRTADSVLLFSGITIVLSGDNSSGEIDTMVMQLDQNRLRKLLGDALSQAFTPVQRPQLRIVAGNKP